LPPPPPRDGARPPGCSASGIRTSSRGVIPGTFEAIQLNAPMRPLLMTYSIARRIGRRKMSSRPFQIFPTTLTKDSILGVTFSSHHEPTISMIGRTASHMAVKAGTRMYVKICEIAFTTREMICHETSNRPPKRLMIGSMNAHIHWKTGTRTLRKIQSHVAMMPSTIIPAVSHAALNASMTDWIVFHDGSSATPFAPSWMLVQRFSIAGITSFVIHSATGRIASWMSAHACFTPSRKPSLVFHRYSSEPASATIAKITMPITEESAVSTVETTAIRPSAAWTPVMTMTIPVTSRPKVSSSRLSSQSVIEMKKSSSFSAYGSSATSARMSSSKRLPMSSDTFGHVSCTYAMNSWKAGLSSSVMAHSAHAVVISSRPSTIISPIGANACMSPAKTVSRFRPIWPKSRMTPGAISAM
jgi:hypothetical protein